MHKYHIIYNNTSSSMNNMRVLLGGGGSFIPTVPNDIFMGAIWPLFMVEPMDFHALDTICIVQIVSKA
jgi:hypothetical protein